MPDIPAHRAARFVAAAIELAIGERITVCTPFAPDALRALLEAAPQTRVDIVTHDLRTAEAAEAVRMALPPERRDRAAIHIGDDPGAGSAGPHAVLLWPNGWEGNARIRAQIVQALSLLPAGGRLYLLAAQHRGGASLLALLRRLSGSAEVAARGPGGLRLLAAVKQVPAVGQDGAGDTAGSLHEQDSAAGGDARGSVLLIEADVLDRHFVFKTAPGVFSHLALNAGTRFFLETLEEREGEFLARCVTMLDLGCGYGPVGIVLAAVHPRVRVVLADVDSRAVDLAGQNVLLNEVAGRAEARLSDGLRHLGGLVFDAILSHFPLHVPREEQIRLLREAHDALTYGGQVYLCALATYDLRPALRAVFGLARTVAEGRVGSGDRYRVVAASKSGGAAEPLITPPGWIAAGSGGVHLMFVGESASCAVHNATP